MTVSLGVLYPAYKQAQKAAAGSTRRRLFQDNAFKWCASFF